MSSSKGDSSLAEGEKALKRSTLFGFGKGLFINYIISIRFLYLSKYAIVLISSLLQ
jgi:hypothetical protein